MAANARNEGGAAGGHRRARETDWTAPHSLRYLHVRFRQAHARAEPGGMRRIPEHKERAIGTLQRGDSHFGWCERLLRYLLVSHQAPGPTGEEPAAQEESELAAAEECREFRVDGPRGAHERLGKLGEAGAPGPRCELEAAADAVEIRELEPCHAARFLVAKLAEHLYRRRGGVRTAYESTQACTRGSRRRASASACALGAQPFEAGTPIHTREEYHGRKTRGGAAWQACQ